MPQSTTAVKERERRSTAGTRMTSLVGQAAKDDDEFWNHSTWVEEEDGSFHESDEESEAQKDTFDSDFDDSEEEEEEEGSQAVASKEEADVLMEEKRDKRAAAAGKRSSVDVVSAGRELLQKRKNASQRKKALRGDGINAGLVLNVPASGVSFLTTAATTSAAIKPQTVSQKILPNTTNKISADGSPDRKSSRVRTSTYKVSNASAKRSLRMSTINNSIQSSADQQQAFTAPTSNKGGKRGRRKFTQEELILEAVQITEAENERWLLSRKRSQNEENTRMELNKKLKLGENNIDRKVICKYNSKRGCYNTLTFPSMDHVPEIFTRPRIDEKQRQLLVEKTQRENLCVITGKKARYRDPKSGKGYYDSNAFKELRRRLAAKETLDQSTTSTVSPDKVKSSSLVSEKSKIKNVKKNANNDLTKKSKKKSSTSVNNNDKSSKVQKEKTKSKKADVQPAMVKPTSLIKNTISSIANDVTKVHNESSKKESSTTAVESHIPMSKIISPSTVLSSSNQQIKMPAIIITQQKLPKSGNGETERTNLLGTAKDDTISFKPTDDSKGLTQIEPSTSQSDKHISSTKDKALNFSSNGTLPNQKKLPISSNDVSNDTGQHQKSLQKENTIAEQSSNSVDAKGPIHNENVAAKKITNPNGNTKKVEKKPSKRKRTSSTSSNQSSSSVNGRQNKHFNVTNNPVASLPAAQHANGNNSSPYMASSSAPNSMPFIPALTSQHQNTNTSQQYPINHLGNTTNPSMYHNALNHLAQLSSQQQFYQPSALDIASLYAMSLSQQHNMSGANPLHLNQSPMFYNNPFQGMLNGSNLAFGGYPSNASTAMLSQQQNVSNSRGQKDDEKDKEKGKLP